MHFSISILSIVDQVVDPAFDLAFDQVADLADPVLRVGKVDMEGMVLVPELVYGLVFDLVVVQVFDLEHQDI